MTAFTDSGTEGECSLRECTGTGCESPGGCRAKTVDSSEAYWWPKDKHPSPGETCPRCERRVPHPRKKDSPASKVKSLRIPTDEAEAFTETLEAAAHHIGAAGQPFESFKTMTLALALLLQDDTVKGFAKRTAPIAEGR